MSWEVGRGSDLNYNRELTIGDQKQRGEPVGKKKKTRALTETNQKLGESVNKLVNLLKEKESGTSERSLDKKIRSEKKTIEKLILSEKRPKQLKKLGKNENFEAIKMIRVSSLIAQCERRALLDVHHEHRNIEFSRIKEKSSEILQYEKQMEYLRENPDEKKSSTQI